jgi:hypothetical protein
MFSCNASPLLRLASDSLRYCLPGSGSVECLPAELFLVAALHCGRMSTGEAVPSDLPPESSFVHQAPVVAIAPV